MIVHRNVGKQSLRAATKMGLYFFNCNNHCCLLWNAKLFHKQKQNFTAGCSQYLALLCDLQVMRSSNNTCKNTIINKFVQQLNLVDKYVVRFVEHINGHCGS